MNNCSTRIALSLAVLSLFLNINEAHSLRSKLFRNEGEVVQHEEDIQLLIYETETEEDSPSRNLIHQAEALQGITANLFGQGQHFDGFGSKFTAVKPLLEKMSPNTLVVVSDGRDVLINNPVDSTEGSEALQSFREFFEEVTFQHPGSIVVSAEAQCCVSALTYLRPGDLYDAAGQRQKRACSSGEADCLWNGDDKAVPWEEFMKDVAIDRMGSGADALDDVYLNAGLIAGKASDLLRVINAADIGITEDDQAVLTDFMYHNPDSIILDYGQTMFGNNRGGLGGPDTCVFELPEDGQSKSQRLVHSKTHTSPLFVHSPGGYLQCHDDLASQLGIEAVSRKARRRLREQRRMNYSCPLGKKLDGSGYCVEDWCCADFHCPANSHRIADRQCYNNFFDCDCDSGYHKEGSSCVPDAPACPNGKKMDGSGYCVDDWCCDDFHCPANSHRIADRQCYDNFFDCDCDSGYHKDGNSCVPDVSCPWGWKLDGSGYCVRNWCNYNYQCPSGMERKPDRECYDDRNDCRYK